MARIACALLLLDVDRVLANSPNTTLTPSTSPAPTTEVCEAASLEERVQCVALGGRCLSTEADCAAEGGTFQQRLCGSSSSCGCCKDAPTAAPTPAPTVDRDAQRAALMQLFEATNGQEWARSYFWNTSAPVCEWFGVSCDDDGHVIELNLPYNSLRGLLPPALANLTRMVHL